eukprot:TRINITY_DN9016_c8_g1_i1.p1 TRINITY_DN9016_c8_g1~~TRINITY_DN9016_c8_g1_i1.p1  ORF type:complete len:247 (+),score=44.01 TRINITY_DN9016_c8_g1_i1:82-822(+)
MSFLCRRFRRQALAVIEEDAEDSDSNESGAGQPHASRGGWCFKGKVTKLQRFESRVHTPQQKYRLACSQGNSISIEKALKKCEDRDEGIASTSQTGFTGLHSAAVNGNIAVTKLLLREKIIPVDAQANGGMTPLMLAAANGHATVVEALLQAGADPELILYGARGIHRKAADLAENFGHIEAYEAIQAVAAEKIAAVKREAKEKRQEEARAAKQARKDAKIEEKRKKLSLVNRQAKIDVEFSGSED